MNPQQKNAFDTLLSIADMQPPAERETTDAWLARAVTEGLIDDRERMAVNRFIPQADTAQKTLQGVRAQLVH